MQCTNISVYKDVDDLDLYVGGLLEKNDGDSILGPVFKCIIGRQFRLLKKGDRFFYDLSIASNKKVAFNLEELNEVRSDCQQICFKVREDSPITGKAHGTFSMIVKTSWTVFKMFSATRLGKPRWRD